MRFRRTECRRAVDACFAQSYQSFSVVDRLPYDASLGRNQCYMPFMIPAVIAIGTFVAANAPAILMGVTLVGTALSVAGQVTGNSTLSWIGMGMAVAGGVGGLANSFANASTAAAGAASKGTSAAIGNMASGGQKMFSAGEGVLNAGINSASKVATAALPGALPVATNAVSQLPAIGGVANAVPPAGRLVSARTPMPFETLAVPPVNSFSTQPLSTTSGYTTPNAMGANFADDAMARAAVNNGLLNRTITPPGDASGGFFNSVGRWVESNPLATMIGAQTLAPMIPSKLNQSTRAYYDANAANTNQSTAEAAQRLRWAQGLT